MKLNRHYILYIFVCLVLLYSPLCIGSAWAKDFVVVIDPGHGGHDPGAVGKISKEKNINLNVCKGEILGIAGIDNSGQKELTEVITGVLKPSVGQVLLKGQEITGHAVSDIRKQGVGFIPQDRHRHGLALSQNIRDNLILGYQREKEYNQKGCFFNEKMVSRDVEEKIKEFDIRPADMQLLAQRLSGGNQQKIIVAREVSHAGSLIIADQPTRGVDIGAAHIIHKKIMELRDNGCAVLLISADLSEALKLSDVIAVMYEGEIVAYFDNTEGLNEEKLGLYMLGLERHGEEQIRRARG